MSKTHIKVFITKNLKFRAVICENTNPTYEVIVGGEQWQKGKGCEYKDIIKMKCALLITGLENKYNELFGENHAKENR